MPLRPGMVQWPGDPPFALQRVHDLARGDSNTTSALSMSAHAGTHIDAPAHYLRRGVTMDAMPLGATVGAARVLAISDPQCVTVQELLSHNIRPGERLLFKTRNSRARRETAFRADFVYINEEAARFLAARRVQTVGVDYLSVGSFKSGTETHRILLRAGIWIIEGFDLSGVAPGRYEMVCLPLRIAAAEGAPARAFLRAR